MLVLYCPYIGADSSGPVPCHCVTQHSVFKFLVDVFASRFSLYLKHNLLFFWSMKSESVSRSVVSSYLRPHGHNPPGSSVHGILQPRILECIAIPFSRVSSWPKNQTHVSCIAGRFFIILSTREALLKYSWSVILY